MLTRQKGDLTTTSKVRPRIVFILLCTYMYVMYSYAAIHTTLWGLVTANILLSSPHGENGLWRFLLLHRPR